MVNYIKSEFYRISRGKEIYLTALVLAGLTVLMNTVLYFFGSHDADFAYATVRFSFNTLTSSLDYLFMAGAVIAALLFAEERKNGTVKNSVSYGISRSAIFAGKCIVCVTVSLVSMVVILGCYIGSALLLLEGPGTEPLTYMLSGIGAALPSAVAAIVLAITVFSICRQDFLAGLSWTVILYGIPGLIKVLGYKIEAISNLSKWLPVTIFSSEVTASMRDYNCVWESSSGLVRCLAAGVIWIVIFSIAGILFFRKKDI